MPEQDDECKTAEEISALRGTVSLCAAIIVAAILVSPFISYFLAEKSAENQVKRLQQQIESTAPADPSPRR